MSGVSAAPDIWSVSCKVIELLSCEPLYYNLQPMLALLRTVQVLRFPRLIRVGRDKNPKQASSVEMVWQ